MRALALLILLIPNLSLAAPAWLHIKAKDKSVSAQTIALLDAALGHQRAVPYPGIFDPHVSYVFDDAQTAAVLAILDTSSDPYQIRHATSQATDWFADLPPDGEDMLKQAHQALSALSQLITLVAMNNENQSLINTVPDGTELANYARTMAHGYIRRLGEARLPATDRYLLTFGHALDWAARPLLDRDDHLLARYLVDISTIIRSNRQTMAQFSRLHPEYVKAAQRQGSLQFRRLGVNMGDAATDRSTDHHVNHMLDRGIGVAVLRLTVEDASKSLRLLNQTIRSWYGPIESHVAARNEADQFYRFALSMNHDLAKRAWANHRAGRRQPADIIAEYARAEQISEVRAASHLEQRADDATSDVFRVDGDLIFYEFIQTLAYGDELIVQAYPGDRVRLLRYHAAVTQLFLDLLTTNPPKHPATLMTLLEYATVARDRMRKNLDGLAMHRSELDVRAYALRNQIVGRLRQIDFDECEASLTRRGLASALRRFNK